MSVRMGSAVALSATLFVGACGAGPKPALPTVFPTAPNGAVVDLSQDAGTPAPTRPPVISDLAQQNTLEGAEAFTLYWFDVLNWAHASQNVELLEQTAESECDYCLRVLDLIQDNKRNGVLKEGGHLWASEENYLRDMAPEQPIIEIRYEEEAGRTLNLDGSTRVEWDPVPPVQQQVLLVWSEDGWLVRAFGDEITCSDCS